MYRKTPEKLRSKFVLGNSFDVLAKFPDSFFKTIITDPPYFNTNLEFDKNQFDWHKLWELINLKTSDNGVQVMFSQIKPALDVINSNRRNFRYQIVWNKSIPTGFLSCKQRPLRTHELILVFSRKINQSTYNPQFTTGKPYSKTNSSPMQHYNIGYYERKARDTTVRYPKDVLAISNRCRENLHPTQKPLELIKYLIETYSNPNDLILDPFAGSGTTAIACKELKRRYFCIEQDPKYYHLALQRIAYFKNN